MVTGQGNGLEAAEVLTVGSSYGDNQWIMNSRCSFDMCPNQDVVLRFEGLCWRKCIYGK